MFKQLCKNLIDSLGVNTLIGTRVKSILDFIITNNEAINAIANAIPYFLGGSADLSHSNKTNIKRRVQRSKTCMLLQTYNIFGIIYKGREPTSISK